MLLELYEETSCAHRIIWRNKLKYDVSIFCLYNFNFLTYSGKGYATTLNLLKIDCSKKYSSWKVLETSTYEYKNEKQNKNEILYLCKFLSLKHIETLRPK